MTSASQEAAFISKERLSQVENRPFDLALADPHIHSAFNDDSKWGVKEDRKNPKPPKHRTRNYTPT